MNLPPIEDKVILRAGGVSHFVPSSEYSEFWDAFYQFLSKNFSIEPPMNDVRDKINPYFGNFGFVYQATSKIARFFHLGVDISGRAKTSVRPIADGILEYSGFGHINGKYVFLSHPEIKTEDGFMMYTIYMHLKTLDVGFGAYQKMLRRISFNKYPNILVKKSQKIGGVGSTGDAANLHAHLHLQVEFRNENGKIIVIDPAPLIGLAKIENLTANIKNEAEFRELLEKDRSQIKKLGIEKYWKI